MKILKTEVTPLVNEPLYVDIRQQSYLWSPFHEKTSFHSHPELELHFVVEGFGKRIIGKKIEPFQSGDMVFIGSNVPHVWLSDPVFFEENTSFRSKVIVTYFNSKTFLQLFNSVKEFEDIREMIRQSSRGIHIYGETRNKIAEKLETLNTKQGFEKIECILQIMNLIAVSGEKCFIEDVEDKKYENASEDRLIDVLKFVKEHLHEQIFLRQVAEVACMTEKSFCRFFRKRTNKSFFRFLNELRISQARQYLLQTDKSVADIAYHCGFTTSSHFCSVFREYTGKTPKQFKATISKTYSPNTDKILF